MASGSSDHDAPMADVQMFDAGNNSASQATPNPFYTTPPPRAIPRGPGHDFNGEPIVSTFSAINSLPDAQLEAHQQFHSSLPFPPPLTIDAAESSDDSGDSPSIGAKIRSRTRSLISDANRVGLQAFSLQCAAKVDGTPARAVTTLDFPRGRGLKVEGATLVEELGPVLEAHPTFIDGFTRPWDDDILNFIEEASGVWDNKKKCYVGGVWNPETNTWRLPEKASLEKEIYPWMLQIITAIMTKFNKCPPGVEREVIDTHDIRFQHKEDNYTSPDLVVRACGLSFEKPKLGDVGYSSIATFFDVKRECDMGNRDAHIKQLGTYVRQLLAHQPNRMYVQCLLLSEKTCRLVHFDRSGAQASPRFNIHTQYMEFIRLIVALTNPKEKAIGFDDSIQWTIDPTSGRKIAGTLAFKTAPGPGNKKTYSLVDIEPIATHVIRGRATTCWSVQDPDTGEKFVVKDSWTSTERTPEYKLLIKATTRNLQGVCEYVSHQTGRPHTKNYRCKISIQSPFFHDRVASRILMKAYGKRVQFFKTVLQLLSALYDAISGHVELSAGASILHRDINERNVLLGLEDAPLGWRGVLIDLNVAIDLDLMKETSKEARTGSRFFQSLRTLDFLTGLTNEVAPAHDYLDDLEAFFYLLCWILLRYLKDGTLRPVEDTAWKVIRGWDSEDVENALNSKSALFNPGRRLKHVAITCIQKEWGQECATLFRKFLEWVGHIQAEKERIRSAFGPQDPEKESIYKPLLNQIIMHYTQVLAFFEEAVVAFGGSCAKPPSLNNSDAGPSNAKRPRSPLHEPEQAGPNPVRPRRVSTRLASVPVV